MATSSSRPSGAWRSAGWPASGLAVEEGPLAADRVPLLARAVVVDEAEDDVAHGRAVGHGDGERVVREAALRVRRAVDGVDDDEGRRARGAVVDLPALLGDRREARALRVQAVELVEDGLLGVGVDDERPVAALPRLARLRDALGPGARAREDLAERRGGCSAGSEPVVLEDGPGRAHVHILGGCPRRSPASPPSSGAPSSTRRAGPSRSWPARGRGRPGCSWSGSPGSWSRGPRRRRSRCWRSRRTRPTSCGRAWRPRSASGPSRSSRSPPSRTSRCGSCATRRSRRAWTPSSSPRRPRTASRSCSSGSTSSRSPTTTSRATPPRRSPGSSPASIARRTRGSPRRPGRRGRRCSPTTRRGRSASASSPSSTRATTACSPSAGRSTGATSSCVPTRCWPRARTCGRGPRSAGATCSSTTSRTRRGRRHGSSAAWWPSTGTSRSRSTRTSAWTRPPPPRCATSWRCARCGPGSSRSSASGRACAARSACGAPRRPSSRRSTRPTALPRGPPHP